MPFAVAAVAWTASGVVTHGHVEPPPWYLLVPGLAAVAFRLVRLYWLYAAKVPCTALQRLGAASENDLLVAPTAAPANAGTT